MGGRNDKGKKKAIEKPKKPKRTLSRMNAPLVIREPDSVNSLISKVPSGFNKSKARTFSGRNPTVPIQQPEEDSESNGLNESDEMNNAEVSDDEMELDDNIEAADPSNIASSSHENTARRGYDLPRQRNSGDHPKTVSIFQNILRPDDIPPWFCPEIRFRFNELWETFEATDEVFRDVMWESFKQWYIVPAEIHDAVHKLFLEQLASCYKNFVARMKMAALRRAKCTMASPLLLEHPPPFLKNKLPIWKRWVDHWCSEKQLKIVAINSRNRRSQNGAVGTHAGGSKSHTRSSAQIVDSTGELPSIAKRLKLYYGKKDDEGNPTEEMVNPLSKKVLEEWTNAVKATYGADAEVEKNKDSKLYLTLPSVQSKKKKGRIFAYGTTKNAYLKFDTGSSSQEASNDPRMSQESSSRESENSEKCLKLAKLVEALSSLVIKQENKINYLVDFLKKKMDVEVSGIDDIMENSTAEILAEATEATEATEARDSVVAPDPTTDP